MEWRREIERQTPVAMAPDSSRHEPSCGEHLISSSEYRVAAGNPDHIEHLLKAAAERERIRQQAA